MGLYTWSYKKLFGEDFQKTAQGMVAESNPSLAKSMVYFHATGFSGISAVAAWPAAENIITGDWIDRVMNVPSLGAAAVAGAIAVDAFNQARKIGREQPEAENR
jgi:hypothetical protein